MNKDVLAKKCLDEDKVEHVRQELGKPCPEGQVNVESVLLLSPFDGLGSILQLHEKLKYLLKKWFKEI
jgi:hypothetical protein